MWWYLAAFVVSFVIAFALIPKPQSAPPPGIGEIKAPTAKEGGNIPVLFGTRWMKGPNVVWTGHKRAVAIKKKGGKK